MILETVCNENLPECAEGIIGPTTKRGKAEGSMHCGFQFCAVPCQREGGKLLAFKKDGSIERA